MDSNETAACHSHMIIAIATRFRSRAQKVPFQFSKESCLAAVQLLRDGLQPSSAVLAQLDSEIDSRQEDNRAYELQDSDDDYRVSEDGG